MSFPSNTTHRFENPGKRDTDRILLGEAGELLADGSTEEGGTAEGSDDTGQGHASEEDPEL